MVRALKCSNRAGFRTLKCSINGGFRVLKCSNRVVSFKTLKCSNRVDFRALKYSNRATASTSYMLRIHVTGKVVNLFVTRDRNRILLF